MCLKWIVGVIFLIECAIGQYVHHPSGGVSYAQNSFFQPHGYNYVAPSGQKVAIYFGSRSHQSPQTDADNRPYFRNNFEHPELSSRFNSDSGWFSQIANSRHKQILFTPAKAGDYAATDKQIEAYNEYLKENQEESDKSGSLFNY
ncbi:hypothetical protein FQR65_LT04056 [Abscondita terminalis]|nr:hypothetical protein FQR65_LT04056 [Abscondita terminalis]